MAFPFPYTRKNCIHNFPLPFPIQIMFHFLSRHIQFSGLKLCSSSPSRFFAAIVGPRCANPKRLRIVLREALSSSSNLTSSKGASERLCSSTLGTDGRSLLPVRDNMEPLRVPRLESRLRRGELANVEEGPRVGDVPPISKDLR